MAFLPGEQVPHLEQFLLQESVACPQFQHLLALHEIKERDIVEYRKIKNAVFAKHTDAKGFITCAISGVKSQMRRDFQIDHIKPMSQGGLTTIDNLQLLTRKAHVEKTRKENTRR
ncbi:MAG: HNH endonuclease signature motif containing protein [Nostoc sp.]